MNWIISNKPDTYDIDYDFYEFGKVDWYQNKMMSGFLTGDTVYVYRSAPIMEIRWECIVGDVGYFFDDNGQKLQSSNNGYNDGPFIELIAKNNLICGTSLSYSQLKLHGLKSKLMGPQKVKGELLSYIQDTINKYIRDNCGIESVNSLKEKDIITNAEKYSQFNINKSYNTSSSIYKRNPYISEYAKLRARGMCQLCGNKAPFNDKKGKPYLESHHIIWLSKGGFDSIDNIVALCPNCHKKMHIVNDQNDINNLLMKAKKTI